jgi:hypothetical protein
MHPEHSSSEREISYDGALYSSILDKSYPEDEVRAAILERLRQALSFGSSLARNPSTGRFTIFAKHDRKHELQEERIRWTKFKHGGSVLLTARYRFEA